MITKRRLFTVMAPGLAALLLAGAGRTSIERREDRGGGDRGGEARGGGERGAGSRGGGERAGAQPNAGRAVYRQRRVTVPSPQSPAPAVQRGAAAPVRPAYPQRDGAGVRIVQPAASAPPAHHTGIVRDTGIVREIDRRERMEREPRRYYWHEDHGVRYSHYYDGREHWYGFYHGPSFYWTRYYGSRWWWYDSVALRWVYWSNGFWWWPGPGGAPYVYVDNNYYPYEGDGVTVVHAEAEPPSPAAPAPSAGSSTNSPDGSRMAQVFGAESQAFLYDKTTSPPTFMRYLGQGVTRVRFSGAGASLQVLVEYGDGTFALFDANGNSRAADVKADESKAMPPPEPPSFIPPPPTSAPGK